MDMSKVALRPRESPYPMLDMSEAFAKVDEVMQQWKGGVEVVSIEEGLGRVVVQALYAKEPMPPFPASVKDGKLFLPTFLSHGSPHAVFI